MGKGDSISVFYWKLISNLLIHAKYVLLCTYYVHYAILVVKGDAKVNIAQSLASSDLKTRKLIDWFNLDMSYKQHFHGQRGEDGRMSALKTMF